MTKKKTATIEDVFAVLPLRDIVVFPHMIVPLFVGREKSIAALEEVMREDKRILLVAQKNASDDDPASEQMYDVGTIGSILQLLKLLCRPPPSPLQVRMDIRGAVPVLLSFARALPSPSLPPFPSPFPSLPPPPPPPSHRAPPPPGA